MIRYLLPAVVIVVVTVCVIGTAYYAGIARGRYVWYKRVQRWRPLIDELIEWRQLELQGSDRAAQLRLDGARRMLDAEEDTLRKELRKL
jgi:hypothetical protein